MSSNGLKLVFFDGVDNWSDIEGAWTQLMPKVKDQCFYQRPEWFRAFIVAYPEIAATLRFFIIYRDDQPVAVFPLNYGSRGRVISIRQISLPVMHQLYMPDVVLASDEDHSVLLDFFLNRLSRYSEFAWDLFTARETLENTTASRAFSSLKRYRVSTRDIDKCSIVRIVPYDQAVAGMRKNFRKNLARRRRQLLSLDDVEFAVEASAERVNTVFREFINLEAMGWKGGHGTPRGRVDRPLAIALNNRKKKFYEQAIAGLAEKQLVEVFSLRVKQELVAAKVWICLQQQCYALKTAFDSAFSQFSPGTLVFDYAYQHQLEKGTTRVINLVFEQSALEGWGTEILRYQNHICFNRSLRGRAAAALYSLRR